MTALTSRERLTRIFENRETDRPAFKLWGAGLSEKPPHPAYSRALAMAREYTDIFAGASSPVDLIAGRFAPELTETQDVASPLPGWRDLIRTIHTPEGGLRSVFRYPTDGNAGLTVEYAVKEPRDIKKLLSLPYEPFPVDVSGYERAEADVGDRGVTLFSLPHAAYAFEDLCGSENLTFFHADEPELVEEIISVCATRLYAHVEGVLGAGIKPVFAWVGPELFLPPLMNPEGFDRYVTRYDTPLGALIKENGGRIWVHSHGKVRNFIERFISMGVDVLNPLEPPKNGDVDMEELVSAFGSRIGLEGNIEIQDILLGTKAELAALIESCVRAGAESGRFILCQSAGYGEYPAPTERYIENLEFYLEYGYQCVCDAAYVK